MTTRLRWMVAVAASVLACESAGSDDAGEVLPVELDGACPLNERVGLFRVSAELDYSAVEGEILDAVVPATIQEVALAEGDCRLLTRANPSCTPACEAGETCSLEGSCVPYPARVSTGTVRVAGLAVDVVMEPRADLRYFETTLPHPVFAPGDPISLVSTGAAVSELALSGRGVEALELDPGPWILAAGAPLSVTWVAGDDPEAQVAVSVNVDQHGLSPLTLACETEDDGELQIPASVVDALLAAGVSGFPTGQAYRRTLDSTSTEVGCVEFQVLSHRSAEVEVAGHTPCAGDSDCLAGQTCDVPTQTCV